MQIKHTVSWYIAILYDQSFWNSSVKIKILNSGNSTVDEMIAIQALQLEFGSLEYINIQEVLKDIEPHHWSYSVVKKVSKTGPKL